jgi:hypothetical protein
MTLNPRGNLENTAAPTIPAIQAFNGVGKIASQCPVSLLPAAFGKVETMAGGPAARRGAACGDHFQRARLTGDAESREARRKGRDGLWMLTWLENPRLFADWVRLQRTVLFEAKG